MKLALSFSGLKILALVKRFTLSTISWLCFSGLKILALVKLQEVEYEVSVEF